MSEKKIQDYLEYLFVLFSFMFIYMNEFKFYPNVVITLLLVIICVVNAVYYSLSNNQSLNTRNNILKRVLYFVLAFHFLFLAYLQL